MSPVAVSPLPEAMSASRPLAAGPGWSVWDIVCTAGPAHRPYEEAHEDVCIAAVTAGSFRYRTRQGTALLAPGSLLLGNPGSCFECGHEHGVGDRCLAFHYEPDAFETILSAVPGADGSGFRAPSLPGLPALLGLTAAAEAARDLGDGETLGEIALALAGEAVSALAEPARPPVTPPMRDCRRITRAVRRIEAEPEARLSLATLATEAAMSEYHFLRMFRQIVGVTPYRFVVRTRLRRAAVALLRSNAAVSAIALEAGFNDLSTFNRTFRQVCGTTPTLFRRRARQAGPNESGADLRPRRRGFGRERDQYLRMIGS